MWVCVPMCGFCNVLVCVGVGYVMCGFVYVCECVGFVMCGCVCVCVCGFLGVGFVMCGCVFIWVL